MTICILQDEELSYLPGEINVNETGLVAEFQAIFGTDAARSTKGVVYFFLSDRPVPRVKGESRVLYIGKTDRSLYERYFRYAGKLASNRSGEFYGQILRKYGPIRIGYVKTTAPNQLEREFFKKYVREHLEYPPKSKVG